MKTVFLSFIYSIGGIVFASEQKQDPLANKANKILDQQISCFQVLGERCSGTNYVHALIEENLKDLKSSGCISKHFIPWYLDKAKINSNSYYQVPIQNMLYIVVIRDVFDWVRSFYETPHHTDGSIKKLSFTDFIRTPWKPKEENIENPKYPTYNKIEMISLIIYRYIIIIFRTFGNNVEIVKENQI